MPTVRQRKKDRATHIHVAANCYGCDRIDIYHKKKKKKNRTFRVYFVLNMIFFFLFFFYAHFITNKCICAVKIFPKLHTSHIFNDFKHFFLALYSVLVVITQNEEEEKNGKL